MLFTQLEFLFFFALVLVLTWLSRNTQWRHRLLLIASYYFYAYWDVRFCGLLLLSTITDYWVARGISVAATQQTKKRLLLLSLFVNLGLLAFFKYCNFFLDSAASLLEAAGLGSSSLSIILPVGISFYTFQTLSYTIDVYRGVSRISVAQVLMLQDFGLFSCACGRTQRGLCVYLRFVCVDVGVVLR